MEKVWLPRDSNADSTELLFKPDRDRKQNHLVREVFLPNTFFSRSEVWIFNSKFQQKLK